MLEVIGTFFLMFSTNLAMARADDATKLYKCDVRLLPEEHSNDKANPYDAGDIDSPLNTNSHPSFTLQYHINQPFTNDITYAQFKPSSGAAGFDMILAIEDLFNYQNGILTADETTTAINNLNGFTGVGSDFLGPLAQNTSVDQFEPSSDHPTGFSIDIPKVMNCAKSTVKILEQADATTYLLAKFYIPLKENDVNETIHYVYAGAENKKAADDRIVRGASNTDKKPDGQGPTHCQGHHPLSQDDALLTHQRPLHYRQ